MAVPNELHARLSAWEDIKLLRDSDALDAAAVNTPRAARLRVFYGGRGIWTDKARTSTLSSDGVTVGVLHTGRSYADDLLPDGIVYHYPRTTVPGRDAQEVEATKAAKDLALPVFVVVQPDSTSRRVVHLGWVEDWDDGSELFSIAFDEAPPPEMPAAADEDDLPVQLERETTQSKKVSVASRPGQHRFSFRVFRRYGPQCAVCDVSVMGLLDAAHLRAYRDKGSDDPRNGLVLCATHHRAFDKKLFAINPSTLQLAYRDEGPGASTLGVMRPSIAHLPARPHSESLDWCLVEVPALTVIGWRWLRRLIPAIKPQPAEAPSRPAYETRLNGWNHRLHFPPIASFYSELWRAPREDPSFEALAKKYGEEKADSEVGFLQTHLPRELVTAAVGLLYTLGRIETILAELQTHVDEHVPRLPEGEPWPEYGYSVGHPLVVQASFEFANFLSWLRTFDERLDRPYLPGSKKREGLLPALADRPLRTRIQELVDEFRRTTLERTLADYQLHAAAVTQPLEGARVSPDYRVSLPIPDRPTERIATRWHLSYDDEREALPVAREAARAVESLVDDLIDAFEQESRAVQDERGRGEIAIAPQPDPRAALR